MAGQERQPAWLPGRFGFLMGLYAENYHRLARLFAPQQLAPGLYVSSVDDGLDVSLAIQQRHRYTLELELTYAFVDAATGRPSPSAQLRVYEDAHVAEALHCHPGRHLWQILGPFPAAHTILQHRLRMNGFLSRWLEYLAAQGHSCGTLLPASAPVQRDLERLRQ